MTIASGYLPILLMILLGMLLAGTFTVVGLYLGPRLRSKVKTPLLNQDLFVMEPKGHVTT